MQEAINEVTKAMDESQDSPLDERNAAKRIVEIAVDNYTGYLLKSAFNLAAAVAQFANDLDHPPEGE